MLRRLSFITVLCALALRSFPQQYYQQRTQVFLTNVLSNALIGGVGGAINKKEGEKRSHAFFKNLVKGAAGGLVKYSAKYQTFYMAQPFVGILASVNRLQFFLGHSMVMNAAWNRKILETYTFNYMGIELRYRPLEEKKLSARLSLASIGNAVAFGLAGYELNLYRSIELGVFYFDVRHNLLPGTGQAGFNCLAIEIGPNPGALNYSPLPHEVTHTYQMYDYFNLASFYDKFTRPKYSEKQAYKVLNKFLVIDYEVLFFTAAYAVQPNPRYYRNYFEFEAEHFRSRYVIKRGN